MADGKVDGDTPRAELELLVLEASNPKHTAAQQPAAEAKAELWRRDQQALQDRLEFESQERVRAQQFQEAQTTKQIDAQNDFMEKQLGVAKEQAAAANSASQAAKMSAWAAIALVILAAISAAPLVRNLLNAPAIEGK